MRQPWDKVLFFAPTALAQNCKASTEDLLYLSKQRQHVQEVNCVTLSRVRENQFFRGNENATFARGNEFLFMGNLNKRD
jgi:hypothetical protein